MPDRDRRILVMGSRDFPNEQLVWKVLERHIKKAKLDGVRLVIVHGACPTGADAFADACAKKYIKQGFNVVVEAHPADWNVHGNAAGPIRNRQMAERGADLGLAFWDGRSPGTLDGIKKAIRQNILVMVYSTHYELR